MAATSRGTIWLRCAALVVFSALVYFPGLTSHGLTNWQESVRLVVAREMHERDAWLVPTRNAEPYLAKPPMIYWVQRGFALARGDRAFSDEFELRATVALFGTLGVLATYLAGRRLLESERAAWWAAISLAVGILYVRSSRIGELDILLVPFVVTAIACIVGAWRTERAGPRWGLLTVATIAATGAVLTKGPPALLTIALGGYASAIAVGSIGAERMPGRAAAIAAALVGACLLVGLSVPQARGFGDFAGVAVFGVIGAALGVAAVAAARPVCAKRWWPLVARAHPWLVLGVPVAAFVGWGRLVALQIGPEKLAALAQTELEDNLRILVPESPINNLGFISYGVAPLGIVGLMTCGWLLVRRRSMSAGLVSIAVWLLLGFVAFSTLGKGVGRYLTPLWPAIALLSGWGIDQLLDRLGVARRRWAVVLGVVAIAAGAAQGWWYAAGRERYESARSARAIARELPGRVAGFDARRCGTYLFESPDLEYYFHEPIEEWGKPPKRLPLEQLRTQVAATEVPYILLVRRPLPAVIEKYGDAREQLAAAGLRVVEVIDLGNRYVQPPGRVPVEAWKIAAE